MLSYKLKTIRRWAQQELRNPNPIHAIGGSQQSFQIASTEIGWRPLIHCLYALEQSNLVELKNIDKPEFPSPKHISNHKLTGVYLCRKESHSNKNRRVVLTPCKKEFDTIQLKWGKVTTKLLRSPAGPIPSALDRNC